MSAIRSRPEAGRGLVWVRVLLALLALAVPGAVPAQSKEGLRGRALDLYKHKKYDEACRLYEKLATDAKVDGALWADLGLCEFRRG